MVLRCDQSQLFSSVLIVYSLPASRLVAGGSVVFGGSAQLFGIEIIQNELLHYDASNRRLLRLAWTATASISDTSMGGYLLAFRTVLEIRREDLSTVTR